MKPRKRYRRTLGHRQDYTVIEITSIGAVAPKKKAAPKATEEKKLQQKKLKKRVNNDTNSLVLN